MKNKVKIPVIVVSSVVAAILVLVIILCSVSVRPFKNFMDYETVRINSADMSNSSMSLPSETVKQKYGSKLNAGLKSTGFSLMHAALEFVGSYGPKFQTVEEDGKTVNKEVTIDAARNACASTESSYRLELEFDSVKELKVKGTVVKFDRLIMNVKSTSGEIRWQYVYLYESKFEGAQNPESLEYTIVPVMIRMNTSKLYNAIYEIVGDFYL